MDTNTSHKKNTAFLIALLAALCASSILCLLVPPKKGTGYTAEIYQEGKLVMSIPLDGVEEAYVLTIKGTGGCTNQVEIRPDGVAVIAADCPDKLCVKQGTVRDSRLPITCLPNRLVIMLKPGEEEAEPDITAY